MSLEQRIENCEALVVGSHVGEGAGDVKQRIQDVLLRVGRAEEGVPNLQACHELLGKMQLDITRRKASLSTVVDRVNELVASRASIEQAVADLKTIEQLSSRPLLNHDTLYDVPSLSKRLDSLDSLLRPLLVQAQQQSVQIDTYLDSYESLVKLMDTAVQ